MKGVAVENPEATTNLCPACGGQITLDCPDRYSLPAQGLLEPTAVEDIQCPHCGQFLWFTVKRLDEATVLTFLPGMIANWRAEQVEELTSATGGVQRVVADLSHFDAIPSVLLGRVLRLHRVLDQAGGRLKLCSLSPKVRIALEATNLDAVFDICDDEASALASF